MRLALDRQLAPCFPDEDGIRLCYLCAQSVQLPNHFFVPLPLSVLPLGWNRLHAIAKRPSVGGKIVPEGVAIGEQFGP